MLVGGDDSKVMTQERRQLHGGLADADDGLGGHFSSGKKVRVAVARDDESVEDLFILPEHIKHPGPRSDLVLVRLQEPRSFWSSLRLHLDVPPRKAFGRLLDGRRHPGITVRIYDEDAHGVSTLL